ncbi:hemolysin family protein [Microbacterium sp. zg-Y818]|uniref:hemolysin family protein n=1 Tax=unclassified Microbacterium TaxID=2609290 RepID=UPI00214B511F|nr:MULTISPECIES: hemolysin family protein [unclassified Microbacterium]MCR2800371.1 hemolysin family protein [Microbacterium sp. zg.Y818]WIM22331.1 hemolysin family protein [Microbacterium sp. zg-Y818]
MNEWIMLGIGLVLTVGTGLFVASEFALVNLDRHELEARRARGERGLDGTISALRITSTHLSSAQLGITLTTLLTGYTFEPAISSLLRGPLLDLGLPEGAIGPIGAVTGILIATLFSMIIGELVPKNFALAVPLATAKLVTPFQRAFTAVFKPLILLFNNTANAVIRSVGIEPKEELSGARSADELSYLIRHSAMAGLLDSSDAQLLRRTLRFASHDASEVMTPRVRMATVDISDTADTVIAQSRSTGFSRFPVIDGTPDRVVGVVHVKHAFAVPLEDRAQTRADALMSDVRTVPEGMGADHLLTVLRTEGLQIAVVGDEYGGTAGIVTLEDLVEEIVGELEDEHDRTRTGILRSGRSVTFDASWRPDEVLDRTGVEIPEEGDYETAGGYVTDVLERLPELGDEVRIAAGTLRVERIDGHRIVRLRYMPDDPETDLSLMTDHDRARESVLKGARHE